MNIKDETERPEAHKPMNMNVKVGTYLIASAGMINKNKDDLIEEIMKYRQAYKEYEEALDNGSINLEKKLPSAAIK